MNSKWCRKKRSWPNSRYHADMWLQTLIKTRTSVRKIGIRADIRTGGLQNTMQANQSTAMFDEFDAGVLAATPYHLLRPSVFTVLLEDDFHIPWECTSF